MNFRKSNELRKKAMQLIPAGAHTYSKGDDQFPEMSPGFIVRGKGTKVWDPDGNQFLDWGMGLRSVILGHADDRVLKVVRTQLEKGSNFTRPSVIEAEIAEKLVNLIPSAEMVKFAKNGSDVTTAAVKLARAYTGKDIILRCSDHPFFSVNDWFIGDTPCNSGVPEVVQQLTKNFRYNDIESLRSVLEENSGRVACVILEPAATQVPIEGFLKQVKELTHHHGAVLIFDEMITGFRWHQNGAQTYYGVTPDLSTFGKAIGNGFSVSALVGKRTIMELGGLEHNKPRVFLLSTTHGAETHALAAAGATIDALRDGLIIDKNWKKGKQLTDGFNDIARELGLNSFVKMAGAACSPYQMFLDKDGRVDLSLRTLYLQEMIKEGVLIPYIAIADAHSTEDIEKTLEASKKALRVVGQAIERGTTRDLLVGAVVKPVFRKYN
ncbi:MAG: glutamate-1-semialdehyde 2,1-aminomutase [Negativicutes bacterium]